MPLLKDKSVLITGAGSGVGRATALACARERARVAVVDLDAESAEETVRLVQAADAEAAFLQADVTQPDQMEAVVRKTMGSFGRLDCAFNNAGVACITGALLIDDYRSALTAAGLDAVQNVDIGKDLNAYAKLDNPSDSCVPFGCCDASPGPTSVHQGLDALLQRFDINRYAASVRVFALKPCLR